MRQITILCLDTPLCLKNIAKIKSRIGEPKIIVENDLKGYGGSCYVEPGETFIEEIEKFTSPGMADVVIVGHNSNTGVAKAKWINQTMRKRTIVRWTGDPYNTSVYKNLGLENFCSPDEFFQKIVEIVQNFQS